MDTALPDISGLELLRQIRLDPDLRRISVVLVKPDHTDDEILFGFSYCTDAHWKRPVDLDLLTRVLKSMDPGPSVQLPQEWQDCWTRKWDAERSAQ